MISPEDLDLIAKDDRFPELARNLESEIDGGLQTQHGTYPYEVAMIKGEYPLEVREAVAQKYHEGGWDNVYHQTSSEVGELPGLTCFILSKHELPFTRFKYHHI